MAKKSSAVLNAKKIASKLKTPKKSKSVERYQAQGQNSPQSKAWTEANDEGVKAKPIGYRWTTLGAEKVGIKNPTAKPTPQDIEKYSGKTFKVKGVTHRYIYIERRVDKSDKSVRAKFEDGGMMAKGGIVNYKKGDKLKKHGITWGVFIKNPSAFENELLNVNSKTSETELKKLKRKAGNYGWNDTERWLQYAIDGEADFKEFTEKIVEELEYNKTLSNDYADGGTIKQAKPQSEVYKTSRDKKVPAKPVGYRYKGNNYNEPSPRVIERELKKPREERKIYYEVRKDKSDYDFYSKFKSGGATSFSGRQYANYNEDMDGKKPAKPVGYRYTDRLAKRLGVSDIAKPTKEHIEKYLGRGVYEERRQDKSDIKPRPLSSRLYSLKDGGSIKQSKPQSQVYKASRDKNVEAKPVGYRYKGNNYNEPSANVIKRELAKPREERKIYYETRKDKSDYDFYSKFKSGGATSFSGRQYANYNEDMDGNKSAKPIGYRYTDKLAKRLGVSDIAKPTKEHIEKYLGRGVYIERRQDKSDLKPRPQSSRLYSLEDGGMMARGGVERIANSNAREYSENLIPFKANNLEGKTLENGDYVVLSYGYYPIWYYCKADNQWYGNSTKYSVTTSKQMSQSRPTYDAKMLSRADLDQLMLKHTAKFENGGVLDGIFGSDVGTHSVGGTTFSNADLTPQMDITNPSF